MGSTQHIVKANKTNLADGEPTLQQTNGFKIIPELRTSPKNTTRVIKAELSEFSFQL